MPAQAEPSAGDEERMTPPVALTIAGFDPSSGAGFTADLKTFSAHGLYGISCATALTVQSTLGVFRSVPVPSDVLSETLACLSEDIEIAGVKIGMLATAENVQAVASFLESSGIPPARIVLDPVLRSSSGAALLDPAGIEILRERLLRFIGWITPNVQELAVLTGDLSMNRERIPAAALALQSMAAATGNVDLHVIVTGGHLNQPDDYLLVPEGHSVSGGHGIWLQGRWVETTSTHGTGCAFSSALLARLIEGMPAHAAAMAAKEYVAQALLSAYPVGHGRGPMNHLHGLALTSGDPPSAGDPPPSGDPTMMRR